MLCMRSVSNMNKGEQKGINHRNWGVNPTGNSIGGSKMHGSVRELLGHSGTTWQPFIVSQGCSYMKGPSTKREREKGSL
jgi:hypothetical protein